MIEFRENMPTQYEVIFKKDKNVTKPQKAIIHEIAKNIVLDLPPAETTKQMTLSGITDSIFNQADQRNGSFQYLTPKKKKLFFLKTRHGEFENNVILEEAEIQGILSYQGVIKFIDNNLQYCFGETSDSAVNLSYYILCRSKEASSLFETNAVVQSAAKILKAIHQAGYSYHKYRIENFIISPGNVPILSVYNNLSLTKDGNDQFLHQDITSFLQSIQEYNPTCNPESITQTFMQAYN